MNPKIAKLKAEREKNTEKITSLQSRNRQIDDSIVKLENENIVGLARATGMTMEELAQHLMQLRKGTSPFTTHNEEEADYAHEE